MSLKAILFDVDGTLADTEQQGHLPAYNQAFAELGLNWHWSPELYRQELLLLPGGRERIRHYVVKHRAPLGGFAQRVDTDLSEWVNEVHAAKSRWFRRHVETGKVTLRPGVARLITEAKHCKIKLALVTNASERSLKPFLHYTMGAELLGQIDTVVSGEQVDHKKPAPDLYQEAMAQLRLAPSDCIAIEDSAMGVCAAAAAGLATLVTTNEDTREHDFSAATAVVSGLGEPDQPWEIIKGELRGYSYACCAALEALIQGAAVRGAANPA